MLTDWTGTSATVTTVVALLPSFAAVMVAWPTPTPVTSPAVDTVATAVFAEDQVTVRPVNAVPLLLRVVAVSCCV